MILASLLALAFREAIRDLLVDPALRIFLFLDALPQGLVWIAAVAILAILAWHGFRWPRVPRERASPKGRKEGLDFLELTGILRRARFSPWARRHLRMRLARLAVALRCEHERINPDMAWAELRENRWPPEPLVRAFFQGTENTSFWDALAHVIQALERYAQGGEW